MVTTLIITTVQWQFLSGGETTLENRHKIPAFCAAAPLGATDLVDRLELVTLASWECIGKI